MGRWLLAILILSLICPRAQAAEAGGWVALTFRGCPAGVPEVLEKWDAAGTFFLGELEPVPAGALLARGHELGLSLEEGASLAGQSRRRIAFRLRALSRELPGDCRPLWLRTGEPPPDPVDQVARAMGLRYLGRSLDAREGLTPAMADRIRSGDVIDLGEASPETLEALLRLLQIRRLQPVTVSRLAREQESLLRPGRVYRKFRGS